MRVYAFDVDGTLETSEGPVSNDDLYELQIRGDYVYIVGHSPARPRSYPLVAHEDRADSLRAIRNMHPNAKKFVYVSANGDQAVAESAGFEFVDAKEFVA